LATKTARGTLATALANLNPWWRAEDWEDADLTAARGSGLDYQSPVLHDLRPGGLYILRGPRRVGKTVATKQAIAALTQAGVPGTSVIRVAVDGWAASDLRTVVQNVALPKPPDGANRWWFIDEATGMVDDWVSVIKWMRDNLPDFAAATVVVTGSDAAGLTAAIGRWAGRRGEVDDRDRTLLPMGFRTFVNLLLDQAPRDTPRLRLGDLHTSVAEEAYQSLVPWLAELSRMWNLYLSYGGFPRVVAAAKRGLPVPQDFVDDVFDVIFRDVFADSQISKTAAATLVSRVMEGMGNPVNYSKIAADAEVTQPTVTRHISYLRNGYLAWACPRKADEAWLAWPKAQPKVYAIDPLVARLPYFRNEARPDVDPTILTEMVLGGAIRRAALAAGHEWDSDEFLFYFRTTTGNEVDFVARLLGDAAIEGKYTSGSWRREAQTVQASAWQGILATEDVLETDTSTGPWAVPAGILGYLLDT
jgi:predicted AAA+ superfamily ATPase